MKATASLSQSRLPPEEQVRRALIQQMVHTLGYPAGRLAVEKDLRLLVGSLEAPHRRIDLLAYGAHLQPLLLIECKAVPLTQAVIDQVIGYNHYVRAPVIAVANQTEVHSGWWTGSTYAFRPGLPAYHRLDPQS